MSFFRNPEIKRQLLLFFLLTATVSGILFCCDWVFGVLALSICLLFSTVHFLVTYQRYKTISSFCADLETLLHKDAQIRFDRYCEGELSILQNSVKKLTVRMRDSEHKLREEKEFLSDSLSDISHQLKTPLTSANLLLAMLNDPALDDRTRQKYISNLKEILLKIDWLVNTLLKISKLDSNTDDFVPAHVSMNELISAALSPLLISMELRAVTVEKAIGSDAGFYGDLSWTAEAITNILKNCMEHMSEGGTLKVEATENAVFSEIVITDDGSGIDARDLPHIFERFYKGKHSSSSSVGIGLALSRMIIIRQNGTVKAENTGHGARFTIRFYKCTI